jgi:hypothetical protein
MVPNDPGVDGAAYRFVPALQDNLGDRTAEMTSFDNVGNFNPWFGLCLAMTKITSPYFRLLRYTFSCVYFVSFSCVSVRGLRDGG